MGDSYTVFNGRLSFPALDERWGVSIWGRNLGDEEYFNFWADGQETLGYVYSHVAAPRTYGVELAYRF